jgi:poly(glycerol-phosphate) alpha-glucosyltransferase
MEMMSEAAPVMRGSSPLRVGMLVGSVGEQGGGVPASVRDLALALRRLSGIEITIFASEGPGSAMARDSWAPVPLHLFPVLGPSTFGFARGLDRALEAAEMDLLHVHGLWMYISIAASRWSSRTRRPYVVSPHGMLDAWAVAYSRWKKTVALHTYERRHLEGAACIHALCEPERQAIRSFGLGNPVCVIPNGVAAGNYVPLLSRSISPAGRTLLFLGRLTPKKGLIALIEAWALSRWRAESAGWELAIAGFGPDDYVNHLRSLVNRLDVAGSVRFIGPVAGAAKAAAFRSADAFILPSISEGQPLAVLEAWSHGLPVLITPQCNLEEGYLARAATQIGCTIPEIEKGLADLFATPAYALREMGRQGRRLVEERFSWAQSAQQWGEVYRWTSGAQARPQSVSGGG